MQAGPGGSCIVAHIYIYTTPHTTTHTYTTCTHIYYTKPAHTQLAINKICVRAESFAGLPRELGNSLITTPATLLSSHM